MSHRTRVVVSVVALGCVTLFAPTASAQTASGIAGVVKDASGGVLPGVTVEASSPALIERVRTVTTDEVGLYKIVDLRPGTYTVTFSLAGFATMKREGIDLPSNFTATINGELRVGVLTETVTVAGASPVVDVQNTAARVVLSREVVDVLPTNRGPSAIIALTPGVVADSATSQDVGGAMGEKSVRATIHGGHLTDHRQLLDGIEINMPLPSFNSRAFQPVSEQAEEISVELGGGNAEYPVGGIMVNYIPNTGANTFKANFLANFTNDRFQGNNLTPALAAQGLTPSSINKIKYIWEASGSLAGPIMRDKLWFFTAQRWWASANYVAASYYNINPSPFLYTPDLNRPLLNDFWNHTHHGNITWQLSPRNKLRLSYDYQDRCDCTGHASSTVAPEAADRQLYPSKIAMAAWTFPASNKLLFEAGTARLIFHYSTNPTLEQLPNATSITDVGINLLYGAATQYVARDSWTENSRFSMSYITGTHTFKTGLSLRQVKAIEPRVTNNDVNYSFRNGVPIQVTLYASPIVFRQHVNADFGLYAQDQWTMKRLTLNYGLRFDYINASVDPNQLAAGPFVSARSFDGVPCVPCYENLSPRLSVAYDLFGTGKTALKANVSGYAATEGLNTTTLANPVTTAVQSVTRSWNDINRNFTPDCDLPNPAANGECGPYSNLNFGGQRITTRYADDVKSGFGNRGYNWQYSASLQHELSKGVAVSVGYYRTTWRNFQVTDNQAVTPANYDPFCITAPADSRLPGGGGYPVCDLYNLNPSKFGQVDNLVTQASHYGNQTEIYNGIDLTLNARLPRGAYVGGGMNTGRTVTDNCFVVDSPQQQKFCHVVPPFVRPQVKLFGAHPLPRHFQASVTFQSLPGIPRTASYVATNVEVAPSLGRSLSGSASTVTIPNLFAPQTMFEGRINQLDVRVTRVFNVGGIRLLPRLDVYNLLNASSVLEIKTQYGPTWLQPANILNSRFAKFEIQVQF